MGPRRFRLMLSDSDGRVLGRYGVTSWALEGGALLLALLLGSTLVAGWQALYAWPSVAAQAGRLAVDNAALAARLAHAERSLPMARRLDADNALAFNRVEAKQGVDAPLWQQAMSEAKRAVFAADGNVVVARGAEEVDPDALVARGMRIEAVLGGLLDYWQQAEHRLRNTPSIRPARTAWLSSSFGIRQHPLTHQTVMHKGLDMAGFTGMLIYAPADGIVIWTGLRGGYGQTVVIDHGWGLQTHYAHLSKYLVSKGDLVSRGMPIAEMGTTGHSTGPHLHYEVRQDGLPLDPRRFILD